MYVPVGKIAKKAVWRSAFFKGNVFDRWISNTATFEC